MLYSTGLRHLWLGRSVAQHAKGIAAWWFSLCSTLSSLRLMCVLRSEGMADRVLPGGLRGLGVVFTIDTCHLFTGRCLSPGEAGFEISSDTPCSVDKIFIYLVGVLVGPYS